MARLGLNLENLGWIRQNTMSKEPDPVTATVYAEIGGADGIVCPLREGLEPLGEKDAQLLKATVKSHLNIQVPAIENLVNLALSIGPDMITLIPGQKPGVNLGKGLDIVGHIDSFTPLIRSIRNQGVVVSLLIEPNIHQVKAASKIGADYVELNTIQYAQTSNMNERSDWLTNIFNIATAGQKIGVGVAASGGLNFQNIPDIAAIEAIEEINIGHAVIARALWVGMEQAVRDMVALIK